MNYHTIAADICEPHHPLLDLWSMPHDQLPFLNSVIEALSQRQPERCIVGVVGPPASGKSTITDQLVEQLNQRLGEEIATWLRMDAYHRTNEELQELGTFLWKGCHFTFDGHGYLEKLREVRQATEDCLCAVYDRARGVNPIPDEHVIKASHQVVVTEGNYLLATIEPWRHIRPLLDYVVFVEVDEQIQKERLLCRHQRSGRTKLEAIAKTQSTDLPNSVFVRQSLENVDFMYRPQANFV